MKTVRIVGYCLNSALVPTLVLSVLAFALAQKPTLNTVDDDLKKAASDRQAQAADQAAATKKVLDGQNAAARTAGMAEERRIERNRQTEATRDAELQQVRETLATIEKDKAEAIKHATEQQQRIADRVEQDHRDSMKVWKTSVISFGFALATGIIMLGITQLKLKKIHKLVNSGYTAQMQNELSSLKTTLITLIELRDLKLTSGAATNGAALEAIEECREHVKTLGEQIKERLAASE